MARKLIRVDEHPGIFGEIIGAVQIRQYRGQKIACMQIYHELNGKKGDPRRGVIGGIKPSHSFRDKRGAPNMRVELIPEGQQAEMRKYFEKVLQCPISFLPG